MLPCNEEKPVLRCADFTAPQSHVLGGAVGTSHSRSPQSDGRKEEVDQRNSATRCCCWHPSAACMGTIHPSQTQLSAPEPGLLSTLMPLVMAVFLIYSTFSFFVSLSLTGVQTFLASRSLSVFLVSFLVHEPVSDRRLHRTVAASSTVRTQRVRGCGGLRLCFVVQGCGFSGAAWGTVASHFLSWLCDSLPVL